MEDRLIRIRTSLVVPGHVWLKLRELAERRALSEGGRPNASALLVELIEREAAGEKRAA